MIRCIICIFLQLACAKFMIFVFSVGKHDMSCRGKYNISMIHMGPGELGTRWFVLIYSPLVPFISFQDHSLVHLVFWRTNILRCIKACIVLLLQFLYPRNLKHVTIMIT